MKTKNWGAWRTGLKDGVPIALGYFAVSFTFGIIAKQAGFNPFEAAFMSGTNFTSAGQFAGVTMIAGAATIFEIALAQLIINSRYFLMSFAISQKIDINTSLFHRLLLAFGLTDEIFGVSVRNSGKLNYFYTYGAMTIALPAWVLGTVFGVISGTALPDRLTSSLSIALYAMLLAVIVPSGRGNKIILGVIIVSMFFSLLFAMIPLLDSISSGVKIIILTIVIAGIAAFLFPVKEFSNE